MNAGERILLTEELAEAAVLGGAVLGGGGGGSMKDGLVAARLAVRMGDVELIPIDELSGDQTVLTVSAVGSPAAKEKYVRPAHFIRTVELFQKSFGVRPDSLITNECGGGATVNGWLQAAALGMALVDAPCNGRAHPTGIMGSMGLHQVKDYLSKQIAVGGDPRTNRYLEICVNGSMEATAAAVRNASIQVGGLVAVARNPVSVEYARRNAAPGAIAKCIGLGKVMLAARLKRPAMAVAVAADFLQGKVLVTGPVKHVHLETRGGFDVGLVTLEGPHGMVELSFWNEYMTAEIDGERLGTFPDLLETLDAHTGEPISTAEIQEGREVGVIHVPRGKLILGAGMKDPALFAVAEQAVGKAMVPYVFPLK